MCTRFFSGGGGGVKFVDPIFNGQVFSIKKKKKIQKKNFAGILKLDAVDAVDALHPHLLKLDAVHPVPTKTGFSASSTY
jgi:hypothetical protein